MNSCSFLLAAFLSCGAPSVSLTQISFKPKLSRQLWSLKIDGQVKNWKKNHHHAAKQARWQPTMLPLSTTSTRNFLSLKRCFWKYGVCAFVNIYLCCHAKIERFELFFLFFFITFFVFFTHAFVKKTKNAFILAFRCNCNWHTHCCCIQILIISFVPFWLKSSRYIKKESNWKLNEKLKEMKIEKKITYVYITVMIKLMNLKI